MIYKKILKDTFVYGIAGSLTRFSSLITLPVYTRVLSIEAFGLLDLYLTAASLVLILFETQMASGYMRNFYTYKEKDALDNLLGDVVFYYLIGYLGLNIFAFILSFYSDGKLSWIYILPITLYILPKQLSDIYAITLRMENQSTKYLLFTTSKLFTVAILGVIAVLFIDASASCILWSIFFGNFIFGIIALIFLKKTFGLRPSKKLIKPLFFYGLPITGIVLLNWFSKAINKFFIITFISVKSLAFYSVAMKLGMLFLLFTQVFKLVWDPIAIKNFSSTINTQNTKFFANALLYYIILGLIAIFIIYFSRTIILNIFAPSQYNMVLSYTMIILFSFFWQGATMIVSSGNIWAKKTYYDLYAVIIGMIISIIFTYFFIETLKLQAVLWGEFLSALICFSFTLYFAQNNIKINYNINLIILLILCSIAVSIFTYV